MYFRQGSLLRIETDRHIHTLTHTHTNTRAFSHTHLNIYTHAHMDIHKQGVTLHISNSHFVRGRYSPNSCYLMNRLYSNVANVLGDRAYHFVLRPNKMSFLQNFGGVKNWILLKKVRFWYKRLDVVAESIKF